MGSITTKECPGGGACEEENPCPANEETSCSTPLRTTRSNLIYLNRAHNKFSILLYQEFAKDGKKPGNQLVGSLGLSLGLGLLCVGVQGKTRDEMLKVLQMSELMDHELLVGLAAMHWDAFRSASPKGCTVEMAVRLFAPVECSMTHDYEEICNQYHLTTLKNVDFVKRYDLARAEINDWAAKATHGLLQDVVPPMGIVDRDTKLFLLCVTYIKVRWKHAFESRKTTHMPFYLQMKEVLQVQMMYQQCKLPYGHSSRLDCDLVEIPFANDYTKMLVLLPKKNDGIVKLEKNLTRSLLETGIKEMELETVDLYLPRFAYETSCPVMDKLQQLGIKEIFNAKGADFSMLSAAEKLKVSQAYQHIQLEFEESESCHASASNIAHLSVPSNMPTDPRDIKLFKADHPFMYIIQDDRTGAIWLLGRVVRPSVV